MLFSSIVFILRFLPVLVLVYFLSPGKAKNLILLIASLIFYSFGEPVFIWLLFFYTIINYVIARLVNWNNKIRKSALITGIILNLLPLIVYKYSNFIIDNINITLQVFGIAGFERISNLLFPVGLSFFSFQCISYLVDVYRGDTESEKDFFDFALYISFFPRVMQGPITRYNDMAAELKSRHTRIDDIYSGLKRFVVGLSKKVIIANTLGAVADVSFGMEPQSLSFGTAWIGILADILRFFRLYRYGYRTWAFIRI